MHSPIDPKSLDQSTKPTDDFFRFVNRRWIDENPIPPEESRWGSFNVLRVEVEQQLKKIFEALDVKSDAEVSSRARKVRDFNRTGMDADLRNRQGDAPLAEFFALVDEAKDVPALSRVIGTLHRNGVDVWWSPQEDADAKQSDTSAFYINQAGLELPDRDYYLRDDAKSREIRGKYIPVHGEFPRGIGYRARRNGSADRGHYGPGVQACRSIDDARRDFAT